MPTLSVQSEVKGIVPTLSAQLLSWSHYERLLQVDDKDALYAVVSFSKYSYRFDPRGYLILHKHKGDTHICGNQITR